MTAFLRLVAIGSVVALGISWVLHAAMKMYGGVGEGTMYAAWIGSLGWLHWVWCGSEAGLGLWLLAGRRARAPLLLTVFVLTVFSAVILLEPQPKPCGCGWQRSAVGREEAVQNVRWSLGGNALLTVLAFVALVARGACKDGPPASLAHAAA